MGPPASMAPPIVVGEDEARRRVLMFLNEHFGDERQPMKGEEDEDTFCVLMYARGHETDPITQFQFDATEGYDELATHIVNKATQDAEGTRKSDNGYILKINGARIGRTSFNILIPSIPHDQEEYEDEATAKGIVHQQMRFTEGLMKIVVGTSAETIRQLRIDLSAERERVRKLEKERIKSLEMVEELTQASHARELETKKAEREDERKEAVVGMFASAIPAMANAFVGARVMHQESTPLEQMILGLGSTFTPEQIQGIASTGTIKLRSDQMMAFLQLFTAMKDKEEGKPVAPPAAGQTSSAQQAQEPQQASPQRSSKGNPNFPMSR